VIRTLFTIFFLITTAFAQRQGSNIPLVLSNIAEQNGLSDDHVLCVLKDNNGFVWVGTSDGLNLVDGSSIKIFRHKDGDTTSLPSSNIISITEDVRNDLLYIGTNKGLCWYDKKKKVFGSATPPPSPYGASADVESIATGTNNKVWCATDGGLFLFDSRTKKFFPFYNTSTEEESDPKYSNKLTHMVADVKGTLWISSNDGLWRFDTESEKFKKIIHKNNDPVYHPLCIYVYLDHDQNVWAGFWNTGLKKYEVSSGKVFDFGRQLHYHRSVFYINEIRQPDGDYLLWLNGDLLAYDEKNDNFFNFEQPPGEKKFPALNPLYQSPDGWVWLGSDNGLYIYNPQRQLFDHNILKAPITSQGICFYPYKNGLLVGAEGSDFLKWKDSHGGILKDYSGTGRGSAALCIKQEKPDDFWIGTTSGLIHADLASNKSLWFHHKEGDSTTLPRDFITSVLPDSKNNLWVFPWREGIWQINKQTGKCRKLLDGFIPEVHGIKKLLIGDAAEDAHGNIWMCDLDEGIIFYNSQTKQFSKAFEKQLGAKYGTVRIFIRGRTAYSFIAEGLLKWNIDSAIVKIITLPTEMNKGLTDLCPDHAGNWWMTSRNGLIVFNERENTFNRFTTADGLVQNDINGTIFCSPDGNMVIGTPGYFTSFNPASLLNSSVSKKAIAVTEILADNKPIDTKGNDVISLSFRDNNILIRWALPDYANPLRNQYYVKLNGIDEDWRYVGNTGEVQYANLSPGTYTIRLKAATANGVASENTADLKFIIHPPVWKTWWFIALASFVLITAFILIVRYISQRNLKERLLTLEKEQAVEKERNRISRDMHDDLGSGLTKIAIMSEVIKKQIHEPEKAKRQLENISESSRELVDNLQDIIWVLNPKNDTLESLAAYIREYALKFFEPFGIDTHFSYPDTFRHSKLSEETRRNLFLVIKESFNNIGKHAWCNHVNISIHQGRSSIQIRIKDDGKGFDTEKTRIFGNGLINMKNRIEQIGGTYTIESKSGTGTETIIETSLTSGS